MGVGPGSSGPGWALGARLGSILPLRVRARGGAADAAVLALLRKARLRAQRAGGGAGEAGWRPTGGSEGREQGEHSGRVGVEDSLARIASAAEGRGAGGSCEAFWRRGVETWVGGGRKRICVVVAVVLADSLGVEAPSMAWMP